MKVPTSIRKRWGGRGGGVKRGDVSYEAISSSQIQKLHILWECLSRGAGRVSGHWRLEGRLWESGLSPSSPLQTLVRISFLLRGSTLTLRAQPRHEIWNFKNAIKLKPAALGGKQLPGDRWWSGFLRRWADWFQLLSAGQGSGRGMHSQAEGGRAAVAPQPRARPKTNSAVSA